jgi:hypothetical protein
MKLVGIILAIISIFIAIYTFDSSSFNSCAISILLFLSAALILVQNGKLNKFIRRTAVALLIFTILKFLLIG